MTIQINMPDITELKPRITVFGCGGAGGNAVNNMISAGLQGVDFVVANTDAQALTLSRAGRIIQMGVAVTEGLGAGSQPEVGRAAAEEALDEIRDHLSNSHMVFITAGMGGGTGTGAAPVVARAAKEMGILTVGVVTKPFHFEGNRRMRLADSGIIELQKHVDTLIVIPNQNLFRVANEKTTFADAFAMADQVLYSGVACITDLMVKEGLINLDFADVRSVMREMGKAMMGTGEASGEKRALRAAEAAIANPLLDETTMRGARGLLISITGGRDMTLYELDEAATRIREEVDQDANIIVGATYDDVLEGVIRVSVVATGIDAPVAAYAPTPQAETRAETGNNTLLFKPISAPVAAAAPMSFAEILPNKAAAPVAQQTFAPRAAIVQPAQQQAPAAAPQSMAATASFGGFSVQQPAAAINPYAAPVQAAPSFGMGFNVAQTQAPVQAQVPVYASAERVEPVMQAEAVQYQTQPVFAATQYAQEQHYAAQAEQEPEARAAKSMRIEDLPMVAQRQIAASRAEHTEEHQDKKQGLMQRLASLSLGRWKEDEEEVEHTAAAPHAAAPAQTYAETAPVIAESVAEKPASQAQIEEDHLEIPAFLRRQAS